MNKKLIIIIIVLIFYIVMTANICKFTRDDMINMKAPDIEKHLSETIYDIHMNGFNKWKTQMVNYIVAFYKYESIKAKPEKEIRYSLSPKYFTYIDLNKPEVKYLNNDIVKLFDTPNDALNFYKNIIIPLLPDFKTDIVHLNDYHFVVIIDIWTK